MLRGGSTERSVRPSLTTWLLWVTLGELLGFTVPAATGALMADASAPLFLIAMVAAGTVEGTLLGFAQAQVLTPGLGIRLRAWVLATAAGAVLAWTAGMLASAYLFRWLDPGPGSVVLAAALASAVLLSIGSAQWVVLRQHVPGAGGWVWVTALAWCVGLTAFAVVTTPLWRPGQGPALVLGVGLLGGLVMAGTVALVTGIWLLRRQLL